MKPTALVLFFTLFLSFFAISNETKDANYWNKLAQEKKFKNDSLYYQYANNAYKSSSIDSEQYIEITLQLAHASMMVSKLDSALFYLKNVKPLINKNNQQILIGRYYYITAAIQLHRGLLANSESNAILAINSFGMRSVEDLAQTYNLLSAVFFKMGKTKQSLETLLKIPLLYENGENSDQLAKAYNNMGNVYLSLGEYNKSLEYYKYSAEIDKELGNFSSLLLAYNNIGLSYNTLGELDSATYYFEMVINDQQNNLQNSIINSNAYLNLGIVNLNKKELDKAIESLLKSKKICEINEDKIGIVLALINLGETYTLQSNYQKAEESLKEGLALTNDIGANRYLEAIYKRLVEVNYRRKDYKQALEYQTAYVELKDSIYDEVEVKVLDNLESKYEQEREMFQDSLDLVRQNNMLALTQEKRVQELEKEQNIRNLLSIFLLFSAGMFFLIYSKYRAQKKSNAIIDSTNEELKKTLISKEEKELLLKEIHHRVKNNLQIISSLMRLQSNTTTNFQLKANYQEMQNRINSMALVHEQLYGSKDFSTIRVGEYANMLIDRVQRVYSGDEVQVIKRIEIRELTIEILIPLGLLVNELLTNCFKYAMVGSDGVIEIELSSNDDGRYLLIRDNGPGVEDIEEVFNKGTFGAELFKTLVEQLDGTYKITSENGFKVEVFF